MSKQHIGTVYSAERNARSPQANVDASRAGVELAVFDPTIRKDEPAQVVAFRPADGRTLAALIVRACDESERMASPRPECLHAAEGYRFTLEPNDHNGALSLEWCPGCGAFRTKPRGEWIRPGEAMPLPGGSS